MSSKVQCRCGATAINDRAVCSIFGVRSAATGRIPGLRQSMSHPAASDESLSLWIDTTTSTDYPSLRGEFTADVAIVGGGITGITAAYLLAKARRSVVLVEKGRIAM